jgi:hypothetical protein
LYRRGGGSIGKNIADLDWPEIFNINSTTTLTLPNASSAQLYISMSARFRIVDAAMRFHSCL